MERGGWYWQRIEFSCGLWANVAVVAVGQWVALQSEDGNSNTWRNVAVEEVGEDRLDRSVKSEVLRTAKKERDVII